MIYDSPSHGVERCFTHGDRQFRLNPVSTEQVGGEKKVLDLDSTNFDALGSAWN